MKVIRRSLVAFGSACVLVGIATTPAGAVGPHEHVVNTPSGSHDIARGFCLGDFAASETQNVALENFHSMIHSGPQGPEGTVTISAHGC